MDIDQDDCLIRKIVSMNGRVAGILLHRVVRYPDETEKSRAGKVAKYAARMKAGEWNPECDPGEEIKIEYRRFHARYDRTIKVEIEHDGQTHLAKLTGPPELLSAIHAGELHGLGFVGSWDCPYQIGNGNHRLRAIASLGPRWIDVAIIGPPEFFDFLDATVSRVRQDEAREAAAREESRRLHDAQLESRGLLKHKNDPIRFAMAEFRYHEKRQRERNRN